MASEHCLRISNVLSYLTRWTSDIVRFTDKWKRKMELIFEQECIPVGCVPAAHWPYAAVCFGGGGLPGPGGLPDPAGGGGWSRGVCLVQGGCLPDRGGCIPACTEADTLPPPCGQNSWHTLVKILPGPNFVAAGKNKWIYNHVHRDHNRYIMKIKHLL